MKPLVYIASPYTKGGLAINVRAQHEIFDVLLDDGRCLPYAPLAATHYQNIVFPRPYIDWITYDLELLDHCHALLRLPALYKSPHVDYHENRSNGADREVAKFKAQQKPVFFSIEDLMDWLDTYVA